MKIVVLPRPSDVAAFAARRIASDLRTTPTGTLGLATGSSPVGVYRELALMVQAGELDVSRMRGFALDEYVGIPREHPQSYARVIERDVVVPLGMEPGLVAVPDGRAADLAAAAAHYESALREAGGIDVQILGIGANGHIGFNEPGSAVTSRTRAVELAESTLAANARFFADESEVPRRALTQGIATILDARAIVLVAQGEGKAEAIRQLVDGAVSTQWPATALRSHPDTLVVIDDAAASALDHGTRSRLASEDGRRPGEPGEP